MMNMRDEYLIHKTHRTFRAWLLPFALMANNLNAISCIPFQKLLYIIAAAGRYNDHSSSSFLS
jgi:hypothetical protein